MTDATRSAQIQGFALTPQYPTLRIKLFSLFTKGTVLGGLRDFVSGAAGVDLLGTTPSRHHVNTSSKHFVSLNAIFERFYLHALSAEHICNLHLSSKFISEIRIDCFPEPGVQILAVALFPRNEKDHYPRTST
ncbi:hypothetical protein NDU88_002629 [Pleurodeles waltl]|uniref:Uncharacterized protein n=1 Tax=Pleurodeles waltl TaxID=8319 RepID=A0AAV7M257_PLEWA|nr:hypothetical protein NDU88_002629 [Pleurodeles waltl]